MQLVDRRPPRRAPENVAEVDVRGLPVGDRIGVGGGRASRQVTRGVPEEDPLALGEAGGHFGDVGLEFGEGGERGERSRVRVWWAPGERGRVEERRGERGDGEFIVGEWGGSF